MGGSSSSARSNQETNNLALDRSATISEGMGIFDSIIESTSDEVAIRTVEEMRAAFSVMTSTNTVQLSNLLELGQGIMAMHDTQNLQMSSNALRQLETGLDMLSQAHDGNKYVIDLVETSQTRTFDLAEGVTDGQQDLTAQALEIVSDVKTDGTKDAMQTMAMLVAVFGLGAIWLTTKDR